MLTFAAIVGRSFGMEVLEAVGDVTGDGLLDALEEAERTYLIMPSSSAEARWEFSHAMIRQTLAESLSVPRRQRLHLRVADAIEKVAAPEAHASDIAHHLQQAGSAADRPKTVRYLTLAGDQALEAGAFDEALRQFAAALASCDGDDQRQIANLRSKKGRALQSLGRWEESVDEWSLALSIYTNLDDSAAMARVGWELAYLLIWSGRGTEAAHIAERVLDVLGPEAGVDRCRLLAAAGWALGLVAERSDDVTAGTERVAESLAMAETLGDPRARCVALLVSAYNHFHCMRRPEQADAGLQAANLLRAAGDLWNLGDALSLFQWASVSRGRLDGFARFEDETQALAPRLGNMGAEMFALYATLARDWLVAADLDQFEATAQRIVELCAKSGMPWGAVAESSLAIASVWRGRWAEAVDRAEDIGREHPGFLVGGNSSVLFLCKCLVGNKGSAVAQLEAERGLLPSRGRPNTGGAWAMLFGVIEGLAVLREREAAGEFYPLALESLATGTVVSWHAHRLLETVAGIAAASGAQWERAETHYQTALQQAHEIPFRSEQPEVRRWYAQMLVDRNATGDRDKARTMLTEAVEMYEQIGMPRHVEMAKDSLKDL